MLRSPAERLALLATVLSCTVAIGAPAGASASQSAPTAGLTRSHTVYRQPAADGPPLTTIEARRPITGERTVLPVLAERTDDHGARWLRVLIPGRPNGRSGWITAVGVHLASSRYGIRVDLSKRIVSVRHDGRSLRHFRAVVGKASTPTPTGRFFVEETVDTGHRAAGGPYALALSARSNVLQEFEGGPGQIALHGRDNLGGTLGRAESHGCLRLSTAAITYLARRIGPGVRVDIQR